jgi:hypothetical protein
MLKTENNKLWLEASKMIGVIPRNTVRGIF